MKRFFSSLTFKIGMAVIVVEALALAIIGFYYSNHFSRRIDQVLENQIQIPATLMSQGLLNFEAVQNKTVMESLVGEELLTGLVIGMDRKVFYALTPEYIGTAVNEIPNLDFIDRLDTTMTQPVLEKTQDGLVCITPLRLDDGRLAGFLYVKVGTEQIKAQKQLTVTIFVLGSVLCVVITSIAIIVLFDTLILTRIARVLNVLKRVEDGDFTARAAEQRVKDEVGTLQSGVNAMIARLQEFMESLEQRIADRTQALETQVWQTTGQAQLNNKMRGEQDIPSLANNVIQQLCKYLDAPVGALYIMQDNELHLVGSYAYNKRRQIGNRFALGEMLVGQAALEKQNITLTDVPEDYIAIGSGLGKTAPRNVLVAPFLYEDQVVGIVELGTLGEFSTAQEAFLETALGNIGIAFITAQARTQINTLLAQTQQQAEELQAQGEALRVANEELETQTESLRDSEARLRDKQGQLEEANVELEEKASVLQKQQAILDQQNQELQRAQTALEQKAADLARASKYKSEFLANMSHELRTPLNSLLLLAGMLQKNESGNLTDDQVESLTIIHNSGRDLLELINDILDLSKVEAGRMEFHFEPVALLEIQETMAAQFIHIAEGKGLNFPMRIAADLPEIIVSDGQRVKQIVKNLLSNAFKFTAQGSVSFTIARPPLDQPLAHPALDPAHTIAFAVSDTGIGISPEQQQIIFEAFQQADGSTSRKYGGTGLGLSISREMAFRLGGYVGVTSVVGRGTTFTLYLPDVGAPKNEEEMMQLALPRYAVTPGAAPADLPPFPPSSPAAVPPPPTSLVPPSPTPEPTEPLITPPAFPDDRDTLKAEDRVLLIIEDDVRFARIIHDFAHTKGFKCLLAGDGATGIHLATTYQPTAITLDLQLPGIDGWGVLRRLKSNPATRPIPVHVISVEDASIDAYKQGVLGFITKPINPEGLSNVFARIEEFIEREVKNLLLVEDDDNLRHSVHKLLAGDDVAIVEAGTGQQALDLLGSQRFDCIILDLRLPDINGFDLLRQIHTGETLPKCPVIVYTGRELSQEEHEQLHTYANSIIVKEAKSPERLLSETALFLHRVAANLQSPPATPLTTEASQETALIGKQILIVDDDMRNTFALSKLLRDKGLIIQIAPNGQRALELLAKMSKIDLILMDVMMPVMDGYETIRKIRTQPQFRYLPILALTAKAMKGDRERCLEAGADDYLTKPVDSERLFSMLRVWLY